MQTCTKCLISFPKTQFYKKKDSLTSHCKSCIKKARKANPEKIKAINKAFYQANKERVLAEKKAYREANREKARACSKKWQKANKGKANAYRAKRRAKKLKATPKWLTPNDWKWIEWYYTQARQLTELTGIKHEVDHIHPLQGETVSGLHVPWNLQVITRAENSSKGNRLTE